MNPDQFVANHVKSLPRSGIRDFFAIVQEMPQAISLGIGEPDFITPWKIREASIFALEKGKTSYTDNRGLLSLRKEISKYVSSFFGPDYDPRSEILVTVGVSEAIDVALRAILNPGDKVLYHEPCYVSYAPSVSLAFGQGIPVGTSPQQSFSLNPEAFEEAWEPGCKILMLNFPTNPTGGTADRAKLERLARFAVEKDLIVISDEIYAELTYEGEHVSLAALPGMKERTILLHGFSKGFAMTGFRVGFACGPDWLIEAMMKIHQYCMMCAPILSQEAAIEALRNGTEDVLRMRDHYAKRRDFIVRRFNEMGLACHLPRGSFYAFPSVEAYGLNEVEFCHRLLREEEVAVVPGTAFGPHGRNHVRASFSTSYEKLVEASERIERFAESLASEKVDQTAV
ncbi:MAG: aromatic amino acid aminotransferase [Opitutae bacterium]|jgi:aminotransferase|nr:aromatic amino acid aminotransferase [Opitutae bacterium]MBO26214.1 aromatic amino acid aminotransferase [Opitutales bacterium]MEC7542548.1 aminotransferase class I/II-fold pyridoxal phosphate-dependent enzyme [Verrucomicrobiota bacterium]MEC7627973.1 aminotransferase class I/II-fold pyridoxal phosphate-dependent enzyme [Verrucomicrobiota bacterium]MEE3060454.1 aminotransferase class I/II-fold pyridoxal phosphate-dependent enzyme [Verrucomicrobiota bacterium]|tara:strand:- start:845 stop:2038 length:1194 start_codon:yes stop_codon:yes gene_type:complete